MGKAQNIQKKAVKPVQSASEIASKSKKKKTNKSEMNKSTKNAIIIAALVAFVMIATVVVVLVLGAKKERKGMFMSDEKHITVTGEQRFLQLCEMVDNGLVFTELYETKGMENYYTGDGKMNYNHAVFTGSDYSWDTEQFFDGTTTYLIDNSNKKVSKYDGGYDSVRSMSMMSGYVDLWKAGRFAYIQTGEEELKGRKCEVEYYYQVGSITGENIMSAYFYNDTLVAVKMDNQYNTEVEFVELVEGADSSCFKYEKPEGYDEY